MKKLFLTAVAAAATLLFTNQASAINFEWPDLEIKEHDLSFDLGDYGEKMEKLLCILECLKQFDWDIDIDWREIDWSNLEEVDWEEHFGDVGERLREHVANCDCCNPPRDVPDGGATLGLLGLGLVTVATVRKRLIQS